MAFDYRELYAPAHFGNSYEVMWSREMRDVLAEAKEWGFNVYGDWFDFADLKSPWNNPRNLYLLPQAIWERKVANFKLANDLGLGVDLLMTPNLVFLDQYTAELAADASDSRFFGELMCPSKPRGREIILENHRRVMRDLYQAGVRVDSLCGCPYDFGGCACAECKPWITTFAQLYLDILAVAREFYPEAKARLAGWWWTREDHEMFKAWADGQAPGRFVSLSGHIPYGDLAPERGRALPQGCEQHAFVHIGYADQALPRDVYGGWGPVIAPTRLAATVKAMAEMGVSGYQAYSEGVLDDVNKAILAGLTSGQFSNVETLLASYAERYFGARGGEREGWAAWLAQWGKPWEVDVVAARRDLDLLSNSARPSWRLAQWTGKLRLFEAHAQVLSRPQWDAERLAAAERFHAAREEIQRGVWGLGLVRTVLNDRYWPPSWLEEWKKVTASTQAAGQAMKEA
jgi:hypothetical protein